MSFVREMGISSRCVDVRYKYFRVGRSTMQLHWIGQFLRGLLFPFNISNQIS